MQFAHTTLVSTHTEYVKPLHHLGLGYKIYFKTLRSLLYIFMFISILSTFMVIVYRISFDSSKVNWVPAKIETFSIAGVSESEQFCL